MAWDPHIEVTVAKDLRTYIRTIRSERLRTNIKFMLYKALIRSVMTYARSTWEYSTDAHLLKLQRKQIRAFRAIENRERRTPIRELHVAFKIPYVYDYITKFCRVQAEGILNHEDPNVRVNGQLEAIHGKYKRLNLGEGQAYYRSAD
jgi:hypothetical protein